MFTERIIPLSGINVDLHESLVQNNLARFIKNLVYEITDTSTASGTKGGQTGVFKPCESNEKYIENLVLPAGNNHFIGGFSSKELKQVYCFIYNDQSKHTIYRLNGSDQTFDIVYQGRHLNFKLDPEEFIHFGACWLEIVVVTDPDTNVLANRNFLFFTQPSNYQRFIAVEDSIATQSFNANAFPFFAGNYDPSILINMGLQTPNDCISITEVALNDTTASENNRLLYQTWQFRLRYYDVWGRPSEYGIISDLYIPGGNACIAISSGLPRCLDLSFDAPPPHINQVEIAYRNCNSTQWYTSDVLDLFEGNPLGLWWLRKRNAKVNFDSSTNKITYRFCADKECKPIAPIDTNRIQNPMPRRSIGVSKVGAFIGLSYNKYNFFPFTQDLKSKIKFTVASAANDNTANDFRSITVYVAIFNPGININQPIFQQGISDPTQPRYGFGAFNTKNQYRAFFAYKQFFPNVDQKGFIGYFAGTNISAISKQFFFSNKGELTEVTDFSGTGLLQFYSKFNFGIYSSTPNGVFLQQFKFDNVPKGRYVFRIASHQFDPAGNGQFQKTSTYTSGLYSLDQGTPLSPINFDINARVSQAKEIVIDACDTNYNGLSDNKILVVFDLDFTHSDIEQGYVINTNETDKTQYGIELLEYEGGDGDKKSHFTDHNGFHFTASTTKNYKNRIIGYCSCVQKQLFSTFSTGNNDNAHDVIFRYLNNGTCPDWNTQPCNQVLIKGRVKLCGADIGISNVSVVLTRGKTTVTDANGDYTLLASDEVLKPNRQDKLYFITNGCAFQSCNGGCIDPIDITIYKCSSCDQRIINIPDVEVTFKSARGLLSGATYPVGVVGWDWLGRPTFVQPLGNITIPSVQESKIFSPSTVQVNIDQQAIFPEEISYVTFWIGAASGIEEYITWIVDKVEFVDNSGGINTIAPTQIKIYYASLIEYNKQNNFNTTVNWNFLSSTTNEPVLSDKVIFMLNGDGTFFNKAITAIVKYDKEGQYFLINYTNDLVNLKENAIIRIVRPKQCDTADLFYEVCSTVDIVDRKAVENNFNLNAFDTYYINREIPVPVTTGSNTEITVRIFGVPFEHNSPSDFWGEGCRNIGRVNAQNPQESEVYLIDEIALSGELSSTGLLNFLNYFDDARKFDFSDANINGIVSVLPETSTILVIGQLDHFVVGFNDNLVRVNADGTAQAASISNAFGKPQRKIGSNYGCLLFDKNTIDKNEGIVQFLDTTKSVLVQHNYSIGVPISLNGADSLVRSKIKEVQNYNNVNGNSRYFTGVINPINNEYLLTDCIINLNSFINNLREFNVTFQETIAFDVISKVFKATYSFTPEGYSQLEGEVNDQQLFSFIKGLPYRHYTTKSNKSYNTFYGINCERVIEVVVVLDNLLKKKPQGIAEFCKQSLYFIDKIETESGQLSRVLKSYFLQSEFGWYAPFLCDINTPFDPNLPEQTGLNRLLDGNILYGTWIKVRLVGDPDTNNIYSEFQGISVGLMGENAKKDPSQ